jgi:hypothetical protein
MAFAFANREWFWHKLPLVMCRNVLCCAVQVCMEMGALHPDKFQPQLPPGFESAATVFHRWDGQSQLIMVLLHQAAVLSRCGQRLTCLSCSMALCAGSVSMRSYQVQKSDPVRADLLVVGGWRHGRPACQTRTPILPGHSAMNDQTS